MNRPGATAVLLLVVAAVWLVETRLTVEDDPLRSLGDEGVQAGRLFARYHERSPFQGRLFVETGKLPESDRRLLETAIADAGYRPLAARESPVDAARRLLALAPTVLGEEEIGRRFDRGAIESRAREIVVAASLPGASVLMEAAATDPLGLTGLVGEAVFRGAGAAFASVPEVRAYESPRPLSYDKVGALYDVWTGLADRARAISGDFFSLANYRAIRRDIVVCTAVALPLNFLLFWVFVRRWNFIVFLFVGSIVSYATGLFVLGALERTVFTLALAFTSTFVSFNNEYLVHLCGLDPSKSRENRQSLGSAIGTTFIGFVALLFADAVIVRQMALVSIGGMAGFLCFLFSHRDVLSQIRLRVWRWPTLGIGARQLVALSVAVAAAVAALGMPPIRTRVEAFGVAEPLLQREAEYFGASAKRIAGETVLGVEAGDDPVATWSRIVAIPGIELAAHPMSAWRPLEAQLRAANLLSDGYGRAVAGLVGLLAEHGVRLPVDSQAPAFAVRGAADFLARLGDLWPSPVWISEGSGRWLVVGVRTPGGNLAEEAVRATGRRVINLNPKVHYDSLLTGISGQMRTLFLAGFLAMGVYLVLMQRRPVRVLYIAFPLLLALAAFLGWLRWAGPYELNVIHLMGFALVISLAVDYSSIAVSSRFGETELTKILITGLSTLASFGLLMLARHPVLRDLGLTVTLGCGVSLVFALFVRLEETR